MEHEPVGRAEADFGRFDAKTVVRNVYILFSRSEIPVAAEDQEIMDLLHPSTPLPPWFTEEDLATYGDLYEKSGFQTALKVVVVAKDFGARPAYLFALLHPDRVLGIITMGVPYVPPGPSRYGDYLPEGFYISRWKEPVGRAEADFGRFDAKTVVRKVYIMFSKSDLPIAAEDQEIMDLVDPSTPLPPWFTEEDLATYGALYEKSGCKRFWRQASTLACSSTPGKSTGYCETRSSVCTSWSFSEPVGRAEADFGRFDAKTVVRKVYILFSRSEIPIAAENQEIMDLVDSSTPLPPWFTEEDLATYGSLYEKSGFQTALKVPYRFSRVDFLKEMALAEDPWINWSPMGSNDPGAEALKQNPAPVEFDHEVKKKPQCQRQIQIEDFSNNHRLTINQRGLDNVHSQIECDACKVVVVAKDFGARPAYLFALLHPDRVLGIITMGVPYVPPGPSRYGDYLPEGFYISRWKEPVGRAEADFGRFDAKTVVRKVYIMFSKSDLPIAAEDQEIMDLVDPSTPLPPWFTEEDLATYGALYEKSGLSMVKKYIHKVVIVAKDFGGKPAHLLALLHPERVLGIVKLGAPFAPPGPFRYGDSLPEGFYINRWKEPVGRAEAEFGRFDAKTVVRKVYILFSGSEIPIAAENQEIMDLVDSSTPLPPWFTEEDLATYGSLYEKSGFQTALKVPYRSLNEQFNLTETIVKAPALLIMGEKDFSFKFPGMEDYVRS
ncbi:hypothetical protein Tsubulata_017411, partial [Turnera subulata]